MSLFAPTFESLRDLYLNELRDLYSAEMQLIDALPKMAEAAAASDLRTAFNEHFDQTLGHLERLERIFEQLGEKPTGEVCEAMKGLIKEGESYIKAGGSEEVRDAGLIGAAQRVEHYEIAAYGTARTLAEHLGASGDAELLQQTLDEEYQADRLLTGIAEGHVNAEAETAHAS